MGEWNDWTSQDDSGSDRIALVTRALFRTVPRRAWIDERGDGDRFVAELSTTQGGEIRKKVAPVTGRHLDARYDGRDVCHRDGLIALALANSSVLASTRRRLVHDRYVVIGMLRSVCRDRASVEVCYVLWKR